MEDFSSFFLLSFGEIKKTCPLEPTCVSRNPPLAAEVKGSSQGTGFFRLFLAGKIWVEDPLDRSENGGTLFEFGEQGFSPVRYP
jgi:hypothetical protein